MTCAEADGLIAAFAVGSLDDGAQPALRSHLAICADCRATAGAYVSAAGQLPLSLEPVAPSAQLRARIMSVVYSDAAGTRAAAPAPETWLRRLWQAIPSTRGWTLAGAGATAVAVVGLGWWGFSARHSASAPQTSVAIAGTTAQPLAHGRLTYGADSHDAVLTVDGLAPLTTGPGTTPTYEVWLIQPGGKAEPAAYLTAEPKGSTWTAAFTGEMQRYNAVAVTLEPSSGSLTPSGQEVLRADLNSTP